MNAKDLLATSLGRRDDEPNQCLAELIIQTGNMQWVEELVTLLKGRDKNIQSDCIKVLYEIGERGFGEMIAPYVFTFIGLLESQNNRLVWGAMTALDSIAFLKPVELFENDEAIVRAITNGSVITTDHGVGILAKLCSIKNYQEKILPKLIGQLAKCPIKQFPMYVEKSDLAMNKETKEDFISIIEIRYDDLEKDSQRKRIDKSLRKLRNFH